MQARALLEVGRCLLDIAAGTEALGRLRQAARLFGRLGDTEGLAASYERMGYLYSQQGRYDAARTNFRKSLKIAEQRRDVLATARARRGLGTVHFCRGQYDRSMYRYLETLEGLAGAEKTGAGTRELRLVRAHTSLEIARIYLALDDNTPARFHFQEARKQYRSLGFKLGEATANVNLGELFRIRRRFATAEKTFKAALMQFRQLGRPLNEIFVLGNLAKLYEDTGRLDEAWDSLQEALRQAREVKAAELIVRLLYDLGSVAAGRGSVEQARILLEESLARARSLDMWQPRLFSLLALSRLHEQEQDMTQAYAYYKELVALNSSRYDAAKLYEMSLVQHRFRLRIEQRQLKLNTEQAVRLRGEIEHAQLKIQKQEARLRQQRLSIEHCLSLLEAPRSGRNADAQLNTLAALTNTVVETAKEQSAGRRNSVPGSQQLADYLAREFPTLSATERKICGFIRAGYSIQETADILLVKYRTVETHRRNIHCKLKLARYQNLQSYIASLQVG